VSKYKHKSSEIIDGIKIKRFFSEGKYGSGIKQLLGYIRYIKEVIEYLKINNFDYLHCHDFDTLVIGYIMKFKNRTMKLVYDEHDLLYLYFDNRKGAQNSLISKLIKNAELLLLKKVDYHIVVSPKMKKLYKNRTNIIVINNAPLRNSFNNIEKQKRQNIVIGFIGAVRYFEELKILLDVANSFSNIGIFIAGKGVKFRMIEEYISQKEFKNVEVFGEYKLEQLEELYSCIDITYLVYPSKDSEISLPNKFFESIVTETPIIADRNSEFGKLVESDSLGWIVDFKNLEQSLNKLFTELSCKKDSLSSYKENIKKNKEIYYWEKNTNKLISIFEN